jgi:hypothetical protein
MKAQKYSNSKVIPIHKQEYDGEYSHKQCTKENLTVGAGAVLEVGVIWPLDKRSVPTMWAARTARAARELWTLRFEIHSTIHAPVTDFRRTSWGRDS